MEEETIEKLFDRLNRMQSAASEKVEQETARNGETARAMYFNGKDIGIAHAKSAIRDALEQEE